MNVAVVGASNNPDRYSYQAVRLLLDKGHNPYPVHPSLDVVAGSAVYKVVSEFPTRVDTVTIYIGVRRQGSLGEDILKRKNHTRDFQSRRGKPGVGGASARGRN